MSRLPGLVKDAERHRLISTESVEAACNIISTPYIENINMSAEIPDDILGSTEFKGNIDIRNEQQKDKIVSTWIEYVR